MLDYDAIDRAVAREEAGVIARGIDRRAARRTAGQYTTSDQDES
jgi:hypothetical protein